MGRNQEGQESKTLISRNSTLSRKQQRDMQKSGLHLDLVGDTAISPGKGEWNLGVGHLRQSGAFLKFICHGHAHFRWALRGAGKGTQALLVFPPICLLMYSGNWILDS